MTSRKESAGGKVSVDKNGSSVNCQVGYEYQKKKTETMEVKEGCIFYIQRFERVYYTAIKAYIVYKCEGCVVLNFRPMDYIWHGYSGSKTYI